MNPYETRSGNGQSQGHQGFGTRVDHLGSSAQQLWSEARGAVTDFTDMIDIKGRLERHPYGTLAAAVGIGYILGGGLFTPLTARIVRLGVRLAALPFVKDELIGMAESALNGFSATVQSRSSPDASMGASMGGPSTPSRGPTGV